MRWRQIPEEGFSSQINLKREDFCHLYFPLFFFMECEYDTWGAAAILSTWGHSPQKTVWQEIVEAIDDFHDNFSSSELSTFGILIEEKHAPGWFKSPFVSFLSLAAECPSNWLETHIKSSIIPVCHLSFYAPCKITNSHIRTWSGRIDNNPAKYLFQMVISVWVPNAWLLNYFYVAF